MNKQDLIQKLALVEHREGGYFAETYRSSEIIKTDRSLRDRNIITSIYYLLTDDRPIGYFHRNQSHIIHYFHGGSSLTYLLLFPNGNLEKIKLGFNLDRGEVLQLIVPGGCWKATILESGEYGLLGEAVAPGFEYRDSELGTINYFQEHFSDLWDELKNYVKS